MTRKEFANVLFSDVVRTLCDICLKVEDKDGEEREQFISDLEEILKMVKRK